MKLLEGAVFELIHVPNKDVIPTPMEIYNHLHSTFSTWTLLSQAIKTMRPIDYTPLVELDKSFIILKGGKLVGKHGLRLISIIHDHVIKDNQHGYPQSISPLA